MPVPKVVKKTVAPAAEKTAPAATPAAPKKATTATATPAPKKVEATKAEAKKTTQAAAPKKASAPAVKGPGRILVGSKAQKKASPFGINEGGRTTRDSFVHIVHENLNAAQLQMPSKKITSDVIAVIEQTLMDVTNHSSFKFAGAMFKLRGNNPRVYSLPTTPLDTYVPAHTKVLYSRYTDEALQTGEANIRGKYDAEKGIFIPGTLDSKGNFVPEKGATPIEVEGAAVVAKEAPEAEAEESDVDADTDEDEDSEDEAEEGEE